MAQEPRPKRLKSNQSDDTPSLKWGCNGLGKPASLREVTFKPQLQFNELEIPSEVQWTCIESEKFSAHIDSDYNLYVSDTGKIVVFRPDGSNRPVVSGLEPHHIVPNSRANYVVVLRKSDKQKLIKVFPNGVVETILESSTPLFGPDVCPNGDIVHHPSTSRLERRSSNGDLLASIEGGRGKVIPFEANSYLTSGQDGHVYFSSKTCVYRWNHQERTVECIAGHQKVCGRRDGFAADARFTHLKRPVLTEHFAYVRESDNRFCRIDLKSYEVATLQMRGLENQSIETYGVTPDGRMMFVICAAPFRIFTASTFDSLESTFLSDMHELRYTALNKPQFVEFIIGSDKARLYADRRILEARSTYFRAMFEGGMREACHSDGYVPIRLGEDVNSEAMECLLRYLQHDNFEPLSRMSEIDDMQCSEILKHAKFALEVYTLADRFLLPRLARLCEVFLEKLAPRTSLVLPLLAEIISPRRPSLINLEDACWRFLEENWCEIKSSQQSVVQELVDSGHPLAHELMKASVVLRRANPFDGEHLENT